MLNNAIYAVNPTERKIVNEGVVSVNDNKLEVLRYELQTFVCDGQYEKGMEHILDVFLRNLGHEQQPAVWISGFYGSGKSHFVKMLSSFWQDVEFSDGARARGISNLPESVKAQFQELNTQAKRFGGLHAAAGTLSAGSSGSVRLALLRIIFKSTGLPESYSNASFVLWLKSEGILDAAKSSVEAKGGNWNEELDNLYVAECLHETLSELKPNLFPTSSSCIETLNNRFPNKLDVTSDEMIKAIKDALSNKGHMPLTLIVLDEVEQYIGENSQRAMDVQEVVEACCKQIGSKLLFIGTGQTAVTGTALLKKLEGRFTIRIELSDADVEAVIRKVILAKRPDAFNEIKIILEKNIGEISRQLSATSIAHNSKDSDNFIQDYPILPVRRRFWESVLRVLDQTGTDSQLRNQLIMVHKAIQTNLDRELGNVIPTDYLYFDLADKMLHARVLPRKVHERTMSWIAQGEDEKLIARACGLIFLINKLSGSNQEIGIKATSDVIADLLVTDLSTGSSVLRSKLPSLLDNCEIIMRIKDEYRIQTEENIAWLDEFGNQKNVLQHETHRISAEREDRIKKKFGELVGKVSISQGISKVSRDVSPTFDNSLSTNANENVYVWVRNGWNVEEESVIVDAKQSGHQSPTVFLFIPKRSADDIRHYLIDYKAAMVTLERKGSPAPITPEGKEAFASMTTIKENAEININRLLDEAFSGAKVFQSGGNEIIESSLSDTVRSAVKNSLHRLYQEFDIADHSGWAKVYEKAKEGSPDSLKMIGYNGESVDHPVCKKIITFIGGGKKGAEIRKNFDDSPFGWSGDAIDGAIQVLLVAGLLRCTDEQGRNLDSKDLERKQMGKFTFKIESVTLSAVQRIQIRKLFQSVDIKVDQGKETLKANDFLDYMNMLALNAGGNEPCPLKPSTALLNDIRMKTGNEQLLVILENIDSLTRYIQEWSELKGKIVTRMPIWNNLITLLHESDDSDHINEINIQVKAIEQGRLLIQEPDMILPLLKRLENELRNQLINKHQLYQEVYNIFDLTLKNNTIWGQLSEGKQKDILLSCGIKNIAPIIMGTYEELLNTLKQFPLNSWNDRKDALKSKFDRALVIANKEIEPKLQTIDIPKRTFRKSEEIDVWLDEVGKQLKENLENGPIILR